MTDLEFLQQTDWQTFFSKSLPTTPWLTVYESRKDEKNDIVIFSGLVPVDNIPKILESESWEISIEEGGPGFVTYFNNGEEITEYHRNLNDYKIEPIVIFREFYGIKDSYFEIQEEFRLFHNLYDDCKRNVLVKIHGDGSEEDAVIINTTKVKVKTKLILQYMAARQLGLTIYFDSFRYSKKEYSEDEYSKLSTKKNEKDISYFVHITAPWNSISEDKNKTISRLLGKRIIFPPSVDKSGIWPFEKRKKVFEEFIIGIDEEGENIYYTCNPDKLNYFGANPNSPHYLTPVFF